MDALACAEEVGDLIDAANDVCDPLRPALCMFSEVTELVLEDDFFENSPITAIYRKTVLAIAGGWDKRGKDLRMFFLFVFFSQRRGGFKSNGSV